jgi:hypothetical protein
LANEKKETDALREHLERFSELGERHLFRFRDGRPFEGWVVEVGEDDLLVTSAGPGASEDEFPVPLADIDPSSLAYVDSSGARIPFVPVRAPEPDAPS